MPIRHRFADIALKQWLEALLRERHSAVMAEPLRENLLKLLQDDAAIGAD